MRRLLALVPVLFMCACGGGSARLGSGNAPEAAGQSGGRAALNISARVEGSMWRVDLMAEDAADLYQIAGTLDIDTAVCSVKLVEAGGGLGGPESAWFVGETDAGSRLDFAYTKRFHGPGASGDLRLLSVVVETTRSGLQPADLERAFTLRQGAGELRVRDSERRNMSPEVR
jgi:hypothetical protein